MPIGVATRRRSELPDRITARPHLNLNSINKSVRLKIEIEERRSGLPERISAVKQAQQIGRAPQGATKRPFSLPILPLW
jgi:hypothetical protein